LIELTPNALSTWCVATSRIHGTAIIARHVLSLSTASRLQGFAHQQKPRRLIGHREGIAVAPIAELELALEVDTPQIIGRGAWRQRRALRTMARPAAAFDQTVPIENRVDRALGRNPNITIEAPNQELADLAGSPNAVSSDCVVSISRTVITCHS
jgi:hypothetical protein